MIKVNFLSEGSGRLEAVDVLGHSGYAEEGSDIVCAAVSSAVMLTHALLYDVKKIPVETVVEDEGAHIRIVLPEKEIANGEEALLALKMHLRELEEDYPEFIKVELTEV